MNKRKLIFLSLDGLTPASLGCYGSSWNSTPNIDGLAATGCIWDRWICEHTDPAANFESWLQLGDEAGEGREDWIQAWKSSGGVELLSDDQEIVRLASKCDFEQLHFVDPTEDADLDDQRPAEDLESTQFAQLIAAAIERLNEPEPWGVLWLHSNALRTRWDAPRWLADSDQLDRIESLEPLSEAEQLELEMEQGGHASEDELPLIFDQVAVPNLQLAADAHPDLIATWMATYACQIRLIDDLLGVLIEAVHAAMDEKVEPTFLVTSTSGMSLGQNGWIGHGAGPIRSCQIHVPMILGQPGPLRVPSVCSANTVTRLLSRLAAEGDYCVGEEEWSETESEFSPCVVSHSQDGSRSKTSSRWYWVSQVNDQASGSGRQSYLFLKPDDVDDVNDVSRLRADVTDQFETDINPTGA